MKKWLCAAVLSLTVLLAGCGESATSESNEAQSEKTIENAQKTDTRDTSQTEETQTTDYIALKGDGTGYATESCSNITYSIPDTWTKKDDGNVVWYRDSENAGILYVRETPLGDIDDIELQNMFVDAPVQGIKQFEGYCDFGTNETILDYGNKAVTMLYTYTDDDTIYTGEAFVINDLQSVVSIVYTADGETDEKTLKMIANDIFGSVELINTP